MPIQYRSQAQFHTSEEEEETSSCSSSSNESLGFVAFLSSPSSDYLVQSFLGEGVYGNVAKCLKVATGETVAVKIMKHSTERTDGQDEMDVLMKLRAFDPDRFNFIKFNDGFIDNKHFCLEFEILDINLLDFMNSKLAKRLTTKEIRPILQQVAITLQLLKSIGIIHTDLKPDNIMMVDHVNQPLRIKVIDFGLARHISKSEWGEYIQPLCYRSPEVILGFPCTTAIDMWALGCIAAELFTGNILYDGSCEHDMIHQIVHTQGPLPQQLLNKGLKTTRFFRKWRKRKHCRHEWRLKKPSKRRNPWTKVDFDSLDDLNKIRPADQLSDEDTLAEIKDRENFMDLLKRMLHLEVDRRISPSDLLEDPFITMNNIADSYPNSLYVKSCCEMMEVCQDQSLSSDNRNQEQPIEPQPSTSTASPYRNTYQAPPAWHNHQVRPFTSDVSSRLSLDDFKASRPQKRSFSVQFYRWRKTNEYSDNGPSLRHLSRRALSDGSTNSPWWKKTCDDSNPSPEKKRINPDGVQSTERKRKRTDPERVQIPERESPQRVQTPERESPQRVQTPERESPERVQTPDRKRKRDSLSSDDVQTPARKRRRIDPEQVQTPERESPERVQAPDKKRKRDSLSSDDVQTPARKRRRMDSDGDRTLERESPERVQTPQKKRKRDSLSSDDVQTPARKRRRMDSDGDRSPERVQTPEKKRKRDSMSSDDVQTPQRKRARMDLDGVQTSKELPQNSSDTPTEPKPGMAKAQPQRKRTWATFVASHYVLYQRPDGSPSKKKRKMSLDT